MSNGNNIEMENVIRKANKTTLKAELTIRENRMTELVALKRTMENELTNMTTETERAMKNVQLQMNDLDIRRLQGDIKNLKTRLGETNDM